MNYIKTINKIKILLMDDDNFSTNDILKMDMYDYHKTLIQRAKSLYNEFLDLLNSDPKFNYKEDEIIDWVEDIILKK